MKSQITPVILSGGAGTRLWPMSNESKPKQFLPLTGRLTMFEMTLQRCQDRSLFNGPVIIGNDKHTSLINDQLVSIGCNDATILLEPCARNTAPAIALAALTTKSPDTILLVMPSDHVISDNESFYTAIESAAPHAASGQMITFGIQPTGPETGYGYIKAGNQIETGIFSVEKFVEKPALAQAKVMISDGGHFWNGGIFLFRADAYLNALASFAPKILDFATKAAAHAVINNNEIRPSEQYFGDCPSDSIDYAVMEKADNVLTIPVSMGWSDLGSWDALYELGENGTGEERAIQIECSGNLIRSDRVRIHAAGVENMIIIASGDDIMIVPRGQSQKVKKIAELLKNNKQG